MPKLVRFRTVKKFINLLSGLQQNNILSIELAFCLSANSLYLDRIFLAYLARADALPSYKIASNTTTK